MIISNLARLVLGLLDKLLLFQLPSFPQSVVDIFQTVMSYVSDGFSLLAAFVGTSCLRYLAVLLGLVLAINAAYAVYSLVFWVLRKIPMLNIKE